MSSRIAVLASGSGTTVEAFIRAGQRDEISCEVGLVICSRKEAGVIQRIADLNTEYGLSIKCILINSKTHPVSGIEVEIRGRQTKAEESAILDAFNEGKFDLIVQMGYMKRSGPSIVRAFGWQNSYKSVYQARMLNTHPGLLPETKGLYGILAQEHVIAKQLPFGGQTLHIVAEEYDDGPVIAEHRVAVEPGDTPESLFAKVQVMEKQMLPGDIQVFIDAQKDYHKQQEEAA